MQFTVFATRYLKQSTQTSYFTATGLNFNTAKPEDATQIILATQTALQQTLKTSTNPAVINDANEKLNAISEFQTAQTRLDAVDSFFRVCGITNEELEAYITYLNTTQKIFDNAKERFGNDILKPEAYEKGGFWREMMDRHPSIAAGSRDVDPKARGKGPAIVMAIPFGKSKRAEAGRWRMERGRLVKTA